MRIRLIQPAMHLRPMDTDLKRRMSPPLGLMTLAGMINDAHDVTIENENVEPLDLDGPADLVGLSVTVDLLPRAAQIAARFRARGIPVVAGGVHPTCDPDGCEPHFDAVCVGPAEDTWLQIVEDAERGRLQSRYIGTSTSAIRAPANTVLDPTPYLYTSIVSTSRGCPFSCDFCYNSAPTAVGYRHREIDDIVSEIRALPTRHVMFVDDNFVADPRWTQELLRRLAPLDLRWNAAVTANVTSMVGLLDHMRETGCESLFIGLETLSSSSLRGVRKRQNRVERYDDLVEALHDRQIMLDASFVFGFDGDEPEIFPRTLDWIVTRRVETVTSHILTPYPGTALHARMAEQGRIFDQDLSHYDTAHVVYSPIGMTADELRDGYLWLYDQIYSWPNIARRLPGDTRRLRPYLLFNILYRKYGRATERLCRMATYERIGRLARRLAYRV